MFGSAPESPSQTECEDGEDNDGNGHGTYIIDNGIGVVDMGLAL